MKPGWMLVGMAGAGVLVIAAIGGLAWAGSTFDPCVNLELSRAVSPDGNTDAVVYRRDCGATTAYSAQVALLPHGQLARGAGNVLAIDMRPVHVQWVDAHMLLVGFEDGARIFRQETDVGETAVRYGAVSGTMSAQAGR